MIYKDEFGEVRALNKLVADCGVVRLEFCVERGEGIIVLGSYAKNVEVLPDSGERWTGLPDKFILSSLNGETWECPMCGALGGKPVEWDFGTDPQTGYADRGTGCTECVKNGGR